MNKIVKKLTALTASIALIFCCFAFSASAAATTTISFSSSKPKVNDSVTVTVTVSGSAAMYSTEFSVSYNPDVMRFESGDSASGGAGVVKVAGLPSGSTKQSYSLKFTAIASGSSTFSASGVAYYESTEDSLGAAATMTVSDAAKSANANLKSLSLSKGTLSPNFSASKTSYTATVDKSVTEVKVYATAQDSGAKVEISGESTLKDGVNTRTVTVTAPSGAQKVYTIKITRSDKVEETSSEPEVNPLETTVNGATYTVLNDISGVTLPVGFSASTATYNDTDVAVAKDADANYILYYLKAAEGEAVEPYLLNGSIFERLPYTAIGDKFYIFADVSPDLTADDGYYETAVKIGDFSVKAYASNDAELVDFYYVYCFYDGGYRIYRYDLKENVLQRAPEFKLISVEEKELNNASLATRFASLSANAKTIVIGLLLVAVGAIALIVLLIIKLVKGRKEFDDDDYSDILFEPDFDEVTVDDGGESNEETATEELENENQD
ncbi:MAG: cadherin-like beta sandwich domain-containing protein [Acutalibacteraceae bacterium]|nr:cadherin-like beta sandwich domain-containing protein [Acutalibacteraceae bacterium]